MEAETVSSAERPFNRHQSLGYLVNQLARLFAQRLERRLAVHGIPLGQFPLLLVLWEENGLTQSEIARRLDFEQPTVANTLRRMMRDGLVRMHPDPTNRKKVLVFLTEKGHRLHDPLSAEARAVNAEAAAALGPEEMTGLRHAIARLTDALR
ncbi:MAG: MarR family transcriptional regulator [Hyphomicrobiaceae bacterium]|nr:MAG: MarR family transcriptional regulator [Hyphomicrobiaceae bacterium]